MIWKSYFLKGVQIGKEWIHELNHQNLGPWNPNTLFGVVKTKKQTKTKWKTTKTKNKNKTEKQLKNRLAYFITGRGLLIPVEPDVRPCSHNFRFCHGFNTSLIQIHKDSLHFSIIFVNIGSIMSHFSHDVPYVQSIPSLQKDLNLPPLQTICIKAL